MTDKPKLTKIEGTRSLHGIQADEIADISIEKGTEHLPSVINIKFKDRTLHFAYNHSRYTERMYLPEEELQKEEIRHAIEKLTYWIKKELYRSVKNNLNIDMLD